MPAAHLLAAKALIGSRWDSRAENASGRLLAEFLAYAELFRRRGEQHRPARSRFSLLDPADTWKVPDWVDLPPIPDGCPGLPSPGRIKAELATGWLHPREVRGNHPVASSGWLHPREVRGSVDMSM